MESCKNIMELLVAEEVKRQLQLLPPRLTHYVKESDLIAFALNQLPALYATTERGLECQIRKGKTAFKDKITQAVQQARAAILRDPIRSIAPLRTKPEPTPADDVLQQLRHLLKNERIDWATLPTAVEQALSGAAQSKDMWVDHAPNHPVTPSRISSPRSPYGHQESGRNDLNDWTA